MPEAFLEDEALVHKCRNAINSLESVERNRDSAVKIYNIDK